jgi:hypothetical protein
MDSFSAGVDAGIMTQVTSIGKVGRDTEARVK